MTQPSNSHAEELSASWGSREEPELLKARQEAHYLRLALSEASASAAARRRKHDAQVKQLERQVRRYRKEAETYKAHLRDVYASRSWKLGLPLRRLRAWLAGANSITSGEQLVRGLLSTRHAAAQYVAAEDPVEAAHRRVRAEVGQIKSRMLKLGFVERGLAELEARATQQEDPLLRRTSAWELAVWHANRYTLDSAGQCLSLLDIVEQALDAPELQRRASVLRAECLLLLGHGEDAFGVLQDALELNPHPDVLLGQCNIAQTEAERLTLINRALEVSGLSPIHLRDGQGCSRYDRIESSDIASLSGDQSEQVTVIVPSYNAENTIDTTLRSLTLQTWRNLQIIVSDDCSSDGTCEQVEAWARRDPRVTLIRGEENAGPYVARNRALLVASGEFVTCNDADDWSHARKIEIQVRHLIENPRVVANTSEQARVSEDLVFYRRGNPGFYLQPNMSSLMFRRMEVVSRIGYWDSVRFAADSEYTRRIKKAFGKNAIVDVPTGPLSFQRQTAGSLTGSETFGYHGFKMGARREYELGHKRFHAKSALPYVPFPLEQRPFAVPEPMRLKRDRDTDGSRRFDVILVSDFRMPGGTSMSNVEEIKAQRDLGLTTGLVQMSLYHMNADREFNESISGLIDGTHVDLVVYGERACCDLLVLRLPWVLQDWQAYIPEIDAKHVVVIVNQPPKRDYSADSPAIYELQTCRDHLERYFGKAGVWYPIGPLVREALETHHHSELHGIDVGAGDWSNIIDVSEWRRPQRPPRKPRIRICRHSRDQYVKWPATREQLLDVYPDAREFEIHVLGGATSAGKVLGGRLPRNWHVVDFGKMQPAAFLAQHDVFVYFTHPDWVESFGRVIFEAMAVGLPVVLPPIYRPLFGDAAIYCQPEQVQDRVLELMSDDEAYDAQVQHAWQFVEQQFGHLQHRERLSRYLSIPES